MRSHLIGRKQYDVPWLEPCKSQVLSGTSGSFHVVWSSTSMWIASTWHVSSLHIAQRLPTETRRSQAVDPKMAVNVTQHDQSVIT
jgi:hypothetical protein